MKNLYWIGMLIIFSCGDNTREIKELAERKYQEKRAEYFQQKYGNCYRQLLLDAQTQADSILKDISKKIKFDSLRVPTDTMRPEKPDVNFGGYEQPKREDSTGKKDN
ncbi:MAG TPA: hypothetical protein PKD32_09135 [Saprospiraceae bacterium]|nr:hypothetical protein [Saprospiraceae bacterium]